jgi:hypothetical protein
LGVGNCSTAGPVVLHEFREPRPGSLPARWRGLTWCQESGDYFSLANTTRFVRWMAREHGMTQAQ